MLHMPLSWCMVLCVCVSFTSGCSIHCIESSNDISVQLTIRYGDADSDRTIVLWDGVLRQFKLWREHYTREGRERREIVLHAGPERDTKAATDPPCKN